MSPVLATAVMTTTDDDDDGDDAIVTIMYLRCVALRKNTRKIVN